MLLKLRKRKLQKKINKILSRNNEQNIFITNDSNSSLKTISKEGIFRGIFFRSIFIERFYSNDIYDFDNSEKSLYYIIDKYKNNKLFRLYYNILGNKHILKINEEALDDFSLAGMYFKELVFPIYFKRLGQKIICYKNNPSTNDKIYCIFSKGYEEKYNYVAGKCKKEITKIYDNKYKFKSKIINKKNYFYSYSYKVTQLFKSINNINADNFSEREY